MKYREIIISNYLEKIKKEYFNCPELWYKSILPKDKADELKKEFKGDFSKIWHEHCSECWKTIDSTIETCYYNEHNKEWLCTECYKKLYEK